MNWVGLQPRKPNNFGKVRFEVKDSIHNIWKDKTATFDGGKRHFKKKSGEGKSGKSGVKTYQINNKQSTASYSISD